MKTAIILGATGLTGGLVVKQLIESKNYAKIKVFTRTSLNNDSPLIEEHLIDLLKLEDYEAEFTGDAVFCCIGTTKKKTPNQANYRAIDYGIPVTAAHLCKKNGIPAIAIVSAIGANPKSSIFYNKTKGEMEQDVLKLKIPCTYILRPSIIAGSREEKRAGERLGLAVFRFLKPLFFGRWKKYAAISAYEIAGRMIQMVDTEEPSQILESNEI